MTDIKRVDFKNIIADLEASGITVYKIALMLHRRFNTVRNWKETGRVEHYDGERLLMMHGHYCKALTISNPTK